MHKNYVILAHRNQNQLDRLIRILCDGESKFFVHIDKNRPIEEFKDLRHMKNVRLVEPAVRCAWGDFSLVQTTLNCIRQVLLSGHVGHTILLSGQDYPIVSNAYINRFLEENINIDFIERTPIHIKWPNDFKQRTEYYRFTLSKNRGDYVRIPYIGSKQFYNPLLLFSVVKKLIKVRPPLPEIYAIAKAVSKPRAKPRIDLVGGTQWFALTHPTITKISRYCQEHPEYLEFHKHTHVPDEIFFGSIVNAIMKDDASIATKPCITYANWSKNSSGPEVLTKSNIQDLATAAESGNILFARKFDIDICDAILDMIDVKLRADHGVLGFS
ncbi:hypothetical protein FAZ69_15145 [Trinickia terrae]|uniref:Peptide O-xylosyltransferase n=1 Tax=Trinickia terrae TaxID=2571161 RepID=A0A4U1I341_9BURK|nr:beta-1,6-N-acetylglucosaminyltransferase [Trinickia terrae]TKC87636.1 hypothetical protein FAZ69_15145 [Trinickia terrae]